MFRVGLGQDSHRLKPGKRLVLGGITVSRQYCLEADSDGDVIVHSLCNALSTAGGGGSLDTWAGAMFKQGISDSRQFLIAVMKRIKAKGYKVVNASVAVEAALPKLEPVRGKLQASLAAQLGIKPEQVGISFTSGEGLTAFGRGEGIQVISVVLLEK